MSSTLQVYYDSDASIDRLLGRTIAIIGFGSQGHAHALNLRRRVRRSWSGSVRAGQLEKAEAAGLDVRSVADAARAADIIMLLVPDQDMGEIYENGVAQGLSAGKTLLFAHGFNIHFGEIEPPAEVDVVDGRAQVARAPVRSEYRGRAGSPGLVAVHQDASGNALANALAYAAGIGCTRAGVIETSFREETETDLFGEQAVLCGGVTALVKAGFETLIRTATRRRWRTSSACTSSSSSST